MHALVIVIIASHMLANPARTQAQNTLTPAEHSAGWVLLFDGTSAENFRGYRKDGMPSGWKVSNGTITRHAGGGDIITRDQFDDFELMLDWKISKGGNSGIMFNVTEDKPNPWETGPEMQILDDAPGMNRKHAAGANYDLHAAPEGITRPAGQWNQVRLVVDGDHVEYWLNGRLICAFELGSEQWNKDVAASKFRTMPAFGKRDSGHICLQDHGNEVWFRNIRIRTPESTRAASGG